MQTLHQLVTPLNQAIFGHIADFDIQAKKQQGRRKVKPAVKEQVNNDQSQAQTQSQSQSVQDAGAEASAPPPTAAPVRSKPNKPRQDDVSSSS